MRHRTSLILLYLKQGMHQIQQFVLFVRLGQIGVGADEPIRYLPVLDLPPG